MDFISPSKIKNIAAKYGFVFKKGLGQNFLSSKSVLEEIAAAAEIDNEGVIEIGPGFGVLTHELAMRAKKVVALELDERLIPILADTLGEHNNIKVINADVLKTDVKKLIADEFDGMSVSIAANLPYYITTPIITSLIEEHLPLHNLVVMVQKEVAERITAKPGTKNYGAISVLCQFYTIPEYVTTVPADLFVPPPKVDSAVVKMKFRDVPAVEVKDEKLFFRTVKAAFSQRRKTLLNCLTANFPKSKAEISDLLTGIEIEPTRRGETLTLEEFARISDLLS
ncbi:MAG: 16S rRNA (adenine(1518)-N(6)/adenine(1519)-N(6))-dimethyltransferase RsmA [Clostridia bacterium]|nr:16S rRNA (adenine(1518)-N(6)/adenine(1519)-N(6))-dimethyltransferase RsmA [Clostridia bacterium]